MHLHELLLQRKTISIEELWISAEATRASAQSRSLSLLLFKYRLREATRASAQSRSVSWLQAPLSAAEATRASAQSRSDLVVFFQADNEMR